MTLRSAALRPGPHEEEGTTTPAEGGTHQSLLLLVCCVAQFMVILDLSIVNVALPSIQASLGFSAINLQWVVDAYAIAFAGFLMLAGRMSDRFGQRHTLVAALGGFALASLVGGLAPNQGILIAARAAQGLSGAFMAAGSLAAITSSFAEGPARHRAIGLWGAMNGAGGTVGVLMGGVLTQAFGWRWVFLINPPIGIAAAIIASRVVVERRRREARFDLGGALTLTGGLVVLAYGLVGAGYLGWSSPEAIGPIVAGIMLLALFMVIESRFASAPLVPLKSLTGQLRNANLIVLLFSAAIFPMWYVSSLYLQQVLALSPLDAGLAFLPMALVIMVAARRAGSLVGRYGVRTVLVCGLAMMAGGMLLFARIGTSGSAIGFIVLPGLLMAAGIGLSVVPSTIAATQGAQPGQAGLASGLVNTSRQVGGALGIALLISLATQYTSHLIGQGHGVSTALTDGFRLAYLIGAGLCVAAALASYFLLPKPAASSRPLWARAQLPVTAVVVLGVFAGIDFGAAGAPGPPIGAYTTDGAYSFVSAPGLHPPKMQTTSATSAGSLAPGYLMTANFYDLGHGPMVGQSGPLILDNHLQPVWFKPVPTDVVASNLSVQTYEGKPALAWWQGVVTATGAIERGEDIVVDQHYRTVATLHGADGWIITLHSITIRGDNAWVTANKNIPMDLTKYGGVRNGALVDSAVQEYNLKTGKLLFSWDALGHIPLGDSYANPPSNGFPWDAYHVNSIDMLPNGNFVASMRNTWAAYNVNRSTGHIQWTLGGKHSSFKLGSHADFEWQHDVVLHNGSEVSMFDDHCCQISGAGTYLPATGPSRGLVLDLNQSSHTATIAKEVGARRNLNSAYMGNFEGLSNGNALIGWGSQPYISEYSSSGQLLLDGMFPTPNESYRATLSQWVGLPLTNPSVVAQRANGSTTVAMSWNGATNVAAWRVLGGSGTDHLTDVATVARKGFETTVRDHSADTAYRVQALDAQGHVLGTSETVTVGS